MSSDADILAILAELKDIRNELDRLKGFDVPRPFGDFVRIPGDTMTGALQVKGVTTVVQTNAVSLDFFTGGPSAGGRILSWGANNATPGTFWIDLLSANGSIERVVLFSDAAGNVGTRTTSPTAAWSVAEKCAMNADGGFMVKLTNKTGGASVKGEVVHSNSGQDNSVIKILVDVPDPIGVFYESGIADGAEAWVVVAGIADVYFVGNTTRGQFARGFLTADGASYVTGQALSEALPAAPFTDAKHFFEIGHVLESRVGAGWRKSCFISTRLIPLTGRR